MSKNDNSNNLNDVGNSNINIEEILKAIDTILKNTDQNEYIEFCEKYIGQDFETYKVEELKNIYEIGNGLLNQYFVTQNGNLDKDLVAQLQYIVSNIMYNVITKQVNNTRIEHKALNNKLEKNIKQAEELNEDFRKEKMDVKNIKKDMKSITTTIISIILAISIIPTAIAGIEKISADYILPFLSSIILFGIIMITFVYSIYQDKLKISTWIILAIAIALCSCFWGISLVTTIDNIGNRLPTSEVNRQVENIGNE